MVALKSSDVPNFLKSFDQRIESILVFGTDPGMVSETARLIASRLAEAESPPGEILRIEDADLENDPDRLSVELKTVQMFGGPKIVRTTASRRLCAVKNAVMLSPALRSRELPIQSANAPR